MLHQETTATIVNNSNEVAQQNELLEIVERLEPFDSCFAVDYENLMLLFNDQINELSDDLRKGYIHDAQQRLNKMFSLFWAIKDKLPSFVFDSVEELVYQHKKTA